MSRPTVQNKCNSMSWGSFGCLLGLLGLSHKLARLPVPNREGLELILNDERGIIAPLAQSRALGKVPLVSIVGIPRGRSIVRAVPGGRGRRRSGMHFGGVAQG